MKQLTSICFLILTAGLSSCSLVGLHTRTDLHQASTKSYQRGLADGKSVAVRQNYLAAQREKERPKPPPKTVYYDVPVPGHTSHDGVKIAPHTVTIPIVKASNQ